MDYLRVGRIRTNKQNFISEMGRLPGGFVIFALFVSYLPSGLDRKSDVILGAAQRGTKFDIFRHSGRSDWGRLSDLLFCGTTIDENDQRYTSFLASKSDCAITLSRGHG